MARDNPITRRTALKVTGAAAATALIAGCGDDDNGDDDEDEEMEFEGGETVEMDGYQSHWEIDGVENPTLVLEDGEEYTFEWINADGIEHDLEIRNDDGDVLEETDSIEEEGEGDEVTFTAESEMTTYICSYHEASQVGDLVVE